MCLIGGEGEENMGGGGITPISVTPRLSCRSPVRKIFKNYSLKEEGDAALTIVLGVTTGCNPLVGVDRQRVDCLRH